MNLGFGVFGALPNSLLLTGTVKVVNLRTFECRGPHDAQILNCSEYVSLPDLLQSRPPSPRAF